LDKGLDEGIERVPWPIDDNSHTLMAPSDPETILFSPDSWWKQVMAAAWPTRFARHCPVFGFQILRVASAAAEIR
jgi:hypothetical protein